MKKSIFVLAVFLAATSSNAQELMGLLGSNYSGTSGFFINPASSTGNLVQKEVGISAYDFGFSNSFVGLKNTLFSDLKAGKIQSPFGQNYLSDTYATGGVDGVSSINLNMSYHGPSYLKSVKDKFGFGFFTRTRTYFNINTIDNDFLKQLKEGAKFSPLYLKNLTDNSFDFQAMNWKEFGVNFSMKALEVGSHYLKVGVNAKLLIGGPAFYFRSNRFDYSFINDTLLRVNSASLEYGHTNLSDPAGMSNNLITNFRTRVANLSFADLNIGADIGAVYEWRPGTKDNKKGVEGYRLRVGASLMDIGSIVYNNNISSNSYRTSDTVDINLNNVASLDIAKLDTQFNRSFQYGIPNSSFSMRLPTAFSLQVDYKVVKRFYLNFSAYMPVVLNGYGVQAIQRFTLTPRFETKNFEVAMPLTTNNYDKSTIGMVLRVKGFWLGTNDLLTLARFQDQQTISLYFGVKSQIKKLKPTN